MLPIRDDIGDDDIAVGKKVRDLKIERVFDRVAGCVARRAKIFDEHGCLLDRNGFVVQDMGRSAGGARAVGDRVADRSGITPIHRCPVAHGFHTILRCRHNARGFWQDGRSTSVGAGDEKRIGNGNVTIPWPAGYRGNRDDQQVIAGRNAGRRKRGHRPGRGDGIDRKKGRVIRQIIGDDQVGDRLLVWHIYPDSIGAREIGAGGRFIFRERISLRNCEQVGRNGGAWAPHTRIRAAVAHQRRIAAPVVQRRSAIAEAAPGAQGERRIEIRQVAQAGIDGYGHGRLAWDERAKWKLHDHQLIPWDALNDVRSTVRFAQEGVEDLARRPKSELPDVTAAQRASQVGGADKINPILGGGNRAIDAVGREIQIDKRAVAGFSCRDVIEGNGKREISANLNAGGHVERHRWRRCQCRRE